jgi:hypothetical protein
MSFVCDLTVMDAEQRARHVQLTQALMSEDRQETRELEDGLAFRFAADSAVILKIAEFIGNERRCCPFFNFVLEVGAEGAPIWLRITGVEGVKQFLYSELGM